MRAGPPTFIRAITRKIRIGSGTARHRSGGLVLRDRWARSHYPDCVRSLVTGGAGFIGSHLVDALRAEGADVTVLDNLTTGRTTNLDPGVRLVTGSILDADLVDREVDAADEVFHLAAAVGVRHILEDPAGSLRTNIRGTENVLESCAQRGRPVLIASTSEVYGKSPRVPWREDDDRVLGSTSVPRWSYANGEGDRRAPGLRVRGRPACPSRSCATSIRTDPASMREAMGRWWRSSWGKPSSGQPLTVHGDGTQTRCFTYVADTVRGTLLAARSPDGRGNVFNVGTERETTVRELADLIIEVTGSSSGVECSHLRECLRRALRGRAPRVNPTRRVLARSSAGSPPSSSATASIARSRGGRRRMADFDQPRRLARARRRRRRARLRRACRSRSPLPTRGSRSSASTSTPNGRLR